MTNTKAVTWILADVRQKQSPGFLPTYDVFGDIVRCTYDVVKKTYDIVYDS